MAQTYVDHFKMCAKQFKSKLDLNKASAVPL